MALKNLAQELMRSNPHKWNPWPGISCCCCCRSSAAALLLILALCSHCETVASGSSSRTSWETETKGTPVRDFYLGSFNGSSLTFLEDAFVDNQHVYLTSKQVPTQQGPVIVPLSHGIGRVLYSLPIQGRHPSTGESTSFSTTFIFSIVNPQQLQIGDGLAFLIVGNNTSVGSGGGYLGVLDKRSDIQTEHTFAVEFDTWQNLPLNDPDSNHVGIDVNDMISRKTASAGFWNEENKFKTVSLVGYQLQAWIDYDSQEHEIEISVSPLLGIKPPRPLLSSSLDLSAIMRERMYVGFSAATGDLSAEHVVHAWSFNTSGPARDFEFAAPDTTQKLILRALFIAGAAVLAILIALTVWSLHKAHKRGSKVHVGDPEAVGVTPAADRNSIYVSGEDPELSKVSIPRDSFMRAFTEPR